MIHNIFLRSSKSFLNYNFKNNVRVVGKYLNNLRRSILNIIVRYTILYAWCMATALHYRFSCRYWTSCVTCRQRIDKGGVDRFDIDFTRGRSSGESVLFSKLHRSCYIIYYTIQCNAIYNIKCYKGSSFGKNKNKYF